jgi:formylglycine-generating enzyme required for sulfatase activity
VNSDEVSLCGFLAERSNVWHTSRMRTWGIASTFVAAGVVVMGVGTPTQAQSFIDPNSGIEFVSIGAVNNPAWTGGGRNDNRGSVGYVYNIGKFEVTTSQWVEFFNAVLDRPSTDRIPHVVSPIAWGAAQVAPTTPGGTRYGVIPGLDMFPVNGISWRTAAIYANWLHNDKSTDRNAFLNGAYDVSTFGPGPENIGFTDQLTHNPGARYWIPTQDEWIKAAHYDPNRVNTDGTIGGWWNNANSSDSFPAYGPVGVHARTNFPLGPDPNGPLASANAAWGTEFPGYSFLDIPLGAYENAVSPWGLFDTAGATSELTEGFLRNSIDGIPRVRYADGTAMGIQSLIGDEAGAVGATIAPYESRPGIGLRLATSVPTPSSLALGLVACALGSRRRR